MRKKILLSFIAASTLVLGATQLWSTSRANRYDSETASISATSEAHKKSGNGFMRVIKAPFKAISKLFGGGRDDGKPRRMTEKDAERFESAAVVRVNDSRTPAADVTDMKRASAREHLAQGQRLLEMGKLNEAIAELSSASSLDPSLSQAESLLAVAYQRKGLGKRAKEAHARAVSGAPGDAQALNNSGYTLYVSGDYRGAVDHLKRAAKLAPDDQRILNNLALAQSRLGKFKDALKNFTRAGGEFNGLFNTALMLERAGRESEAVKHYERARMLQPDSAAVMRRLVNLYERAGRTEDAEVARTALTDHEKRTGAAVTNKGN